MFFWYWYQIVLIGLIAFTIMYGIKWVLLDGDDIGLALYHWWYNK